MISTGIYNRLRCKIQTKDGFLCFQRAEQSFRTALIRLVAASKSSFFSESKKVATPIYKRIRKEEKNEILKITYLTM